ncbi:MAG: glycosyltransferase [Bryobacteraceae bacterium]
MIRPKIRVLSIMEASFVTGPAKNLLEFAQRSNSSPDELPDIELVVAGYRRGGEPESAFLGAARAAGLPVETILENGRFDRAVPARIAELVRTRNPQIVQTHNVKSHFFLRQSGLWHERAWVAFHHGFTAEDLKMRLYNATTRWSLPAARHVVTVCQPFVQQLVRRGVRRERISVQHNSVKPFPPLDAEARRAARAEIPAAEGTPLIVSIGRLSSEKGHLDLVEAAAQLRRVHNGFHLVLVGEGIERPRIEAARRRLGLEEHVTLVGLRGDVRPYYAMADIVAIPSHSEGSPNVLLEAMIAARPIVATRVGGIPEIVTHQETALLVDARDPAAMARELARLLAEQELGRRLAEQARRLAEESYSPDGYRRALIRLYREILAA